MLSEFGASAYDVYHVSFTTGIICEYNRVYTSYATFAHRKRYVYVVDCPTNDVDRPIWCPMVIDTSGIYVR